MRRLLTAGLVLAASIALAQQLIPSHPRDLAYPELAFEPPSGEKHRLVLGNGLVAYLVRDDALPVVRVRAYVRTGSVYDPPGKEGLAALTFALLRAGGAGDLDADALDGVLDELAATVDAEAGDARATVDAWTHARHAPAIIEIVAALLRGPTFGRDRFERLRDMALNEVQAEEEDAALIAQRHVRRALYGDHPFARSRTAASVEAITREDVLAFHRRHVVPGKVVLAISGAFDEAEVRALLDEHLGDWRGRGKGWDPLPPVPPRVPEGVVAVDRPDNSQCYVELAKLGLRAGDPEEAALTIADHIFGSGSFTSRAVVRVRSDEGLAYACASEFEVPPVVPGVVRTYFQCRAGEASYALQLVLDEAQRLARQGPSPAELAGAKEAVIARFPARFTTAADVARALAESELDGLAKDADARWRARVAAVTAEDVKRATERFFAGKTAIVLVGPVAEARRSLRHGSSIEDFGRLVVLDR